MSEDDLDTLMLASTLSAHSYHIDCSIEDIRITLQSLKATPGWRNGLTDLFAAKKRLIRANEEYKEALRVWKRDQLSLKFLGD